MRDKKHKITNNEWQKLNPNGEKMHQRSFRKLQSKQKRLYTDGPYELVQMKGKMSKGETGLHYVNTFALGEGQKVKTGGKFWGQNKIRTETSVDVGYPSVYILL